jgi:hypothetical protein
MVKSSKIVTEKERRPTPTAVLELELAKRSSIKAHIIQKTRPHKEGTGKFRPKTAVAANQTAATEEIIKATNQEAIFQVQHEIVIQVTNLMTSLCSKFSTI